MLDIQVKPKRKHKRSYSPTMRLKICNEFLSGEAKRKGLTQKQLCESYNIGARTLQNWLNDYKNDYEELLDFYRFIMGDLAANGYRKAAEYLRDYAVDIFTDLIGVKPPSGVEINLTDVLPELPNIEGNDDISNGLGVLSRISKGTKY